MDDFDARVPIWEQQARESQRSVLAYRLAARAGGHGLRVLLFPPWS